MIKKSLILFLFFLFILVFLKSLITLVFIYTDNYFYQWSPGDEEFTRKLYEFLMFALLIPSALLLTGILILRKSFDLKLITLIALSLLAIVFYRFFDVNIRSAVHFSSSYITDAYTDVLVFGLIVLGLYFFIFKTGIAFKKLRSKP